MLLLVSVFLTLWVSCVRGQGRTCDFPQIKHGAIYDESRYRHTFPVVIGKHFYYSCHQNFVSPSQKPWTQITCTEDGWWPTPKCLRLCFFPWVENGQSEASGQTYLQGATVQITCDAGYSLPNSQSSITCGDSGWSAQPICIQAGLSCGPSPEISHGFVSQKKDSYTFGEEVTYSCVEGFGISGPASITCLGGKWSSPPECINTDCSNLPNFGIAKPIGPTKTSYHSGEQVSYSCPEPFQMDGSNIVQCINSNWIGRPTCRGSKGKCGTPPPIDNGDITSVPAQEYALGSRVEYQCQNSYKLEGRATITCQNGEWTEPPKCLDPCVISEDIMNEHKIQLRWVHEKKIYVPSGDYVEFSCKYGYKKILQEPLRSQCIKGKLTYPTCG